MKLEKKIFISAKLQLVTGLHIGDNKENVEIGGVDNPVVRRKDNNEPYIPGSSLKGKMRCLLEQVYGINAESNFRNNGCIVEKLFGAVENKNEIIKLEKKLNENHITKEEFEIEKLKYDSIPSRLIVRDSYLTKEWAEKLKNNEYTDMPYTEIKWENVINRIKGTAEHPRQMERIPAGAEFSLEFVINIFQGDDENKLYELFEKGIKLLEDDYLGGSGSRGYGQIKIKDIKRIDKNSTEYIVS